MKMAIEEREKEKNAVSFSFHFILDEIVSYQMFNIIVDKQPSPHVIINLKYCIYIKKKKCIIIKRKIYDCIYNTSCDTTVKWGFRQKCPNNSFHQWKQMRD